MVAKLVPSLSGSEELPCREQAPCLELLREDTLRSFSIVRHKRTPGRDTIRHPVKSQDDPHSSHRQPTGDAASRPPVCSCHRFGRRCHIHHRHKVKQLLMSASLHSSDRSCSGPYDHIRQSTATPPSRLEICLLMSL